MLEGQDPLGYFCVCLWDHSEHRMQHQFPIDTSFQRSKLDGGGVLRKRQKEKNSGYVLVDKKHVVVTQVLLFWIPVITKSLAGDVSLLHRIFRL